MIWAIYVSDKPHSRINFPIGMEGGVWGVHDTKSKSVFNIKAGDTVTFVYSISWLKAEGRPPKGFSRVSKENVHEFRGLVQQLIFAKVTKSYYRSDLEVWPDGVYPHRFDFEIVEKHEGGVYFGTEFFNRAFIEAVRYSACTQGSVTEVSHINNFAGIREIDTSDGESSGYEGKPIWKLHKTRERDRKLILEKKKKVRESTGRLACEVCQSDFLELYGEIGKDFAECHHIKPLSLRNGNQETKIDELAILCANCHRMIHRRKPWMTILELRKVYNEQEH